MKGKKGWFKEPVRHGLAAKGIKTEGLKTGRLRQKYGLDTSRGSRHYDLRQRGWSDAEAQLMAFRPQFRRMNDSEIADLLGEAEPLAREAEKTAKKAKIAWYDAPAGLSGADLQRKRELEQAYVSSAVRSGLLQDVVAELHDEIGMRIEGLRARRE